MSTIETYTGKIKAIKEGKENIETFLIETIKNGKYNTCVTVKEIEKYGVEEAIDSFLIDTEEAFFYDKNNEILYKVYRKKEDIENVFIAKRRKKSIDFFVSYYNGGCSFNEALEESIARIKNKKE